MPSAVPGVSLPYRVLLVEYTRLPAVRGLTGRREEGWGRPGGPRRPSGGQGKGITFTRAPEGLGGLWRAWEGDYGRDTVGYGTGHVDNPVKVV